MNFLAKPIHFFYYKMTYWGNPAGYRWCLSKELKLPLTQLQQDDLLVKYNLPVNLSMSWARQIQRNLGEKQSQFIELAGIKINYRASEQKLYDIVNSILLQ